MKPLDKLRDERQRSEWPFLRRRPRAPDWMVVAMFVTFALGLASLLGVLAVKEGE